MADQITAPEPAQEDNPLLALANAHMKKMDDIFNAGYEKSMAMCDEVLQGIKKRAGMKNAMLDRALANLGIIEPTEPQPGEKV